MHLINWTALLIVLGLAAVRGLLTGIATGLTRKRQHQAEYDRLSYDQARPATVVRVDTISD